MEFSALDNPNQKWPDANDPEKGTLDHWNTNMKVSENSRGCSAPEVVNQSLFKYHINRYHDFSTVNLCLNQDKIT